MLLQPNNRGTASQGNETFRANNGVGGQAQNGQAFPSQPSQSFPHVIQIPVASAAVSVPSIHAVVYPFSVHDPNYYLYCLIGLVSWFSH